MADGLKRLLTRSRSKSRTRSRPQISEPLEKGNAEGPPLLFRASAYGDTSTGASPVQGLLPLRGNRSYAVRRSSGEYPPLRHSMPAHDSTGSNPRVNRLTKSRSAHASRSSSPDRAPKAEPVELPAPTRRPKSEVITGRWNENGNGNGNGSGTRQRSQRSSRHSSPGRGAPPVPPLPSNTPSEAGTTQFRASSASDRPKRASRQNSWERDGPNSLAAHPPFAEQVASRYNPRRNSQSSVEEPRVNVPAKVKQVSRESSRAGYPHGSPTTAHMDQDGIPKPLEPAWYITRTSKNRSPKEYENDRRAAGTTPDIPAIPKKTGATPPPVELEAPPPELDASDVPPPRPERRRPRTRRSHIQRKNSTSKSHSREGRRSSSQERAHSAGAVTRAAVEAAVAAAAAERTASTERRPEPLTTSALQANTAGYQADNPPDSPRDDVSAVSWATAEDGERESSRTRGPARPADVLFPAEPESRQDTPRALGVQRDRQLEDEATPVKRGRQNRVTDQPVPVETEAADDDEDDHFHVPGAFPTPEEVVRRAQFNSVNTTVHETVAPAVTHEIIIPRIHHVREEQITREIHNHDVYHRVLPIKETVILPAKHFRIGRNGELVELRPHEVPHDSNEGWVFLETVSKEEIPLEPRNVTAQELQAFTGGKKAVQEPRAAPPERKTWFISDEVNPN